MPGRELHDEIRQIVDQAIDELRAEELSRPARLATRVLLTAFKKRRDYEGTMNSVDQLREDLAKIQRVLERTSEHLRQAEQRAGDRSPGSEIWWNTKIRSVTDLLGSKGGEQEGLRLLQEVWVQGLAMGAWDRCRELLQLTELPDGAVDEQEQMALLTDALEQDDAAEARNPLERLLSAPARDVQWTAALGVLRSRALARVGYDRELTIQAARQTIDDLDIPAQADRAAGQATARWRALALTGLAEVLLVFDELDEADKVLQQALEQEVAPPDTLVAAGILAERRQAWVDADQLYESALAAQPALATTPRLLQPTPARLLVRAAADAPSAVAVPLLKQALAAGIDGDGDYPDRDAYLALAARLQALAVEQERSREPEQARQSRQEAAQAYVNAGNRYSWAGLGQRSIELFEMAVESAPDVAAHRWSLAEALRLAANQPGGILDTDILRRARDELRQGLDLETPSPEDVWVLVTKAMIDTNLTDAGDDPALTIERSLVTALDSPGEAYTLGFGFLAVALRRQGYVREAYDAALQGDALDPNEGLVVRQLLLILRDLGDYEGALERVERQLYRWPDDQELIAQKAMTLVRLERYDEAVALLGQLDPTSSVRLELGLTLSARGDEEASLAELRAVWLETSAEDEPDVAGWAAYRVGELDAAIAIYEPLVSLAPADMPYARNLGQMLLVRGDLERGRDLPLRGIDACPYADELVDLRGGESQYLRQQLARLPHQRAAEEVLDLVDEHAERRIQELQTRRRSPDTIAVRAAEARTALHTQRFDEALAMYVELALAGDLPEAPSGVRAAAQLALEVADNVCRSGDRDGALDGWARILGQLHKPETTGGAELIVPLACRGVLAVFQAGRAEPDSLDLLANLLTDARQHLADAADVLCSDIPALWALDDALRAVLAEGRLEPVAADALQAIVDGLPISRVYGTAKEDAGDFSSHTYIAPVALRFGKEHENLAESGELAEAVAALQNRISETVGVRIPWIYFQVADDLPTDHVEFQVYERSVRRDRLDPAAQDRVAQVIEFTEAAVRPNLFRTVGVDDVSLWLEGWDLTHTDAPAWEQADPLADRLRLARVLRLLLREGVTVADRSTIVGRLEASARAGDQGTLRALHDVRVQLGREALGAPPGVDVAFLPDDLEARVRSGLNERGTVWELDRGDAFALVEELRRWIGQFTPADAHVVGVQDARIRPFVWRLLASERPPVRVLAKEELS